MTDNLNPNDRRKTMQAVKGKGTKLEKSLGSMLARMGLRGWKKNAANVAGKPDIAFIEKKLAIFIDGCFWHGCPYCQRKLPATNRDYWERKIQRNVTLAKSYKRQLKKQGWTVIRVWEHEMRDKARIKARIMRAYSDKG